MKGFMHIFRNTLKAEKAFANLSPKEVEAEMKNWNECRGKLAQEGKLIGAQSLFPRGKVVRQGKKLTDGPFIEGKDLVGGYVVIKAKDLEEAIKLPDECPMLPTPIGNVEVREVMPSASMVINFLK